MMERKQLLNEALRILEELSETRRAGISESVSAERRARCRAGWIFLDLVEMKIERQERERLVGKFQAALGRGPVIADPDKVWVIEGEGRRVHAARMLWGKRKSACGKMVDGELRLADPSEINCRANGCHTIAGAS